MFIFKRIEIDFKEKIVTETQNGEIKVFIPDEGNCPKSMVIYNVAEGNITIKSLCTRADCRYQGLATQLIGYLVSCQDKIDNIYITAYADSSVSLKTPSDQKEKPALTQEALEKFYQSFWYYDSNKNLKQFEVTCVK